MARSTGTSSRVGAETVRRVFSFRIFSEAFAELRRVTWPTRQETLRLTLMVIAVSVAIGVFLGLVDLGFARLMELFLGR